MEQLQDGKSHDGLMLRGKVYYANITLNGRRIRKRLSSDYTKAVRWLRKLKDRGDTSTPLAEHYGTVYVIKHPTENRVKIGFTSLPNPEKRVGQIAGAELPTDYEILACVESTMSREWLLHQWFKDERIHPKREWFVLSERVSEWVNDVKESGTAATPKHVQERMRAGI